MVEGYGQIREREIASGLGNTTPLGDTAEGPNKDFVGVNWCFGRLGLGH